MAAKSPFAGLAENASLTFTVASGAMEEDEITGNRYPVMKPVILVAFLKQQSSNQQSGLPKALQHAGIDEMEEVFAGYLTKPMRVPKEIQHLSTAEAVISGVRGTFRIYVPVQSAFPVVTQILGDRIYGIFRRAAG